jgi:hypothetical protein
MRLPTLCGFQREAMQHAVKVVDFDVGEGKGCVERALLSAVGQSPTKITSNYSQSTLLSCEATICHLPPRFNQVSVHTWHTFASGCVLSLPMACSLP